MRYFSRYFLFRFYVYVVTLECMLITLLRGCLMYTGPVVEVEETSLSDSEDEADAREHVATDEKEVTADGGDEKEVTADGGDEKEVTADAGDEKEVTADAGDEKEVTADTGEAQEEKPDNTDESKVKDQMVYIYSGTSLVRPPFGGRHVAFQEGWTLIRGRNQYIYV